MITRYYCTHGIYEHGHGDYVLFADHEAALSETKAILSERENYILQLEGMIEHKENRLSKLEQKIKDIKANPVCMDCGEKLGYCTTESLHEGTSVLEIQKCDCRTRKGT